MDTQMKAHKIVLTICPEDFEQHMGRPPQSQKEFEDWAHLAEKGLLNGHIDWDILHACACEAMADGGD